MMFKNTDKIFAKFREKKLEVVIAEDVLNNAEIIEIYTGERDKEIYNKAIDDCIRMIQIKLIDNLSLANSTKYGNKNAKELANSYTTIMKYEIADCVDDLLDDLEQVKEKNIDNQ